MPWRPHSKARVSSTNPQAWGQCDRCNSVFLLVDLDYQREWAGPALVNLRLKVCRRCMDKPQPQLREKRIGPDPVPVKDPRPIGYAAAEAGGLPVADSIAILIDEPLEVE